jgi:hypothetical protein
MWEACVGHQNQNHLNPTVQTDVVSALGVCWKAAEGAARLVSHSEGLVLLNKNSPFGGNEQFHAELRSVRPMLSI